MITSISGKSAFYLSVCLALFALVAASGLAAKDAWIEVKTPNFIVVSNASESEARKIAGQFEQFREVFHNSFPNFRVDLGRPMIILAVKNEDGLKILLPAYWETKGRVHPAGIFVPGDTRHFVAVRTDIEGDNPYQVVYHEYTHAIMNLNVQSLPIWLGEGLADYFGSSVLHEKEVEIGRPSLSHLMVLQRSRLIPIDALMLADAHSPYYNEQDRVSVFYAESWAIVHYLMLDPDARKRQLLRTFLTVWDSTGSQLQAAQQTFGDLKKFANSMEAYAHQRTFYYTKVQTSAHNDAKSYAVRILSPAEVFAEQSLFHIQMRREKEAKSCADEAVAADPNLALAHEARGLIAFHDQDFALAHKEFARSIELSPTSYTTYFYEAQARLRTGRISSAELPEITANFEKALALNPQFAPAYASLASFYSMHPETREKARAAARKAVELEPGNLNYAVVYGYVLLNLGKTADAKTFAARIQAAARTPQEQQMASQFASLAASGESSTQWRGPAAPSSDDSSSGSTRKTIELSDDRETPPKSAGSAPTPTPAADPPGHVVMSREYHLEGQIAAAECSPSGEVKVTLSINTVLMKFHASDLKSVEVTSANKLASSDKPPCAAWKGQRAKVSFHSVPAGEFDGELAAIYFF